VPCAVGQIVELGPRLAVGLGVDMARVGLAVHAFLAADVAGDRAAMAADLLARHGAPDALAAAEVVTVADRLWGWLDATFAPSSLHREWPLTERLSTGTMVVGTADLVARTPAGYVVVDHKTFPGPLADALARVPGYGGQLAAYARAIQAATGEPVVSTWIHFPVLGHVVELRLA
jgi:ATP-dependent exoDNAse (exonuclease V) beta subunit